MSINVIQSISAIVLVLSAVGCGGNKLKEGYAEVYGKVSLDGEPLANAQVEIISPGGVSFGRTDTSGRYVAEYSRSLNGAATGPATVKIRSGILFRDEKTADLPLDPKTHEHVKKERVPAKYNDKSEIRIVIEPGQAPYDFELFSGSK